MTRMCSRTWQLAQHWRNPRGVRQHALLSLVRMHYLRNEIPAARKVNGACMAVTEKLNYHQLLLEAITVARTSGDKLTLQHCIAFVLPLSMRLPIGWPMWLQYAPSLASNWTRTQACIERNPIRSSSSRNFIWCEEADHSQLRMPCASFWICLNMSTEMWFVGPTT